MRDKLLGMSFGVLLVLGVSLLLSSGCGLAERQLPEGERFRVQFAEPITLCAYRQAFEQAQTNEFWIRIGERPEVEYYQGERLCENCQVDQENTFFTGNRAYFYPENKTYVVYVVWDGSSVKVMKETDRNDVHYQPADDVETMAAVEKQIVESLQMICPLEFEDPFLQMDLEPLTEQTLSE